MNIHENWEKALKYTEIIRARVMPLLTHSTTKLPYIFLAESSLNVGDTVVRKGEVWVERPSLVLPPNSPQFQGFDFEKESSLNQDLITSFLLVRGIRFPSLKYENKTHLLDVYEGRLRKAIEDYSHRLEREENVSTGLVAGPEDCWQFSVLIFTCAQALKSADGDIRKLLEEFRKKGRE